MTEDLIGKDTGKRTHILSPVYIHVMEFHMYNSCKSHIYRKRTKKSDFSSFFSLDDVRLCSRMTIIE